MARQSSSSRTAVQANLTIDQLQRAIPKLKRRIADVESFAPELVPESNPSAVTLPLETAIKDTLMQIFGAETVDYQRYQSASSFDWPINIYEPTPIWEIRDSLKEEKERSLALLRAALRSIEEQIQDAGVTTQDAIAPTRSHNSTNNRRVFIVHGHDEGPREAIARFLEKLGFTPVILHEQANRGATIIEKFEKNADVGFAIILLTPDDVGSPKAGALQPRARQNVILELGYFVGRLGRDRVCALKSGDLEIPSDILGVVWSTIDASGGWKSALGKELQAAGYEVDWNKVMRN